MYEWGPPAKSTNNKHNRTFSTVNPANTSRERRRREESNNRTENIPQHQLQQAGIRLRMAGQQKRCHHIQDPRCVSLLSRKGNDPFEQPMECEMSQPPSSNLGYVPSFGLDDLKSEEHSAEGHTLYESFLKGRQTRLEVCTLAQLSQ